MNIGEEDRRRLVGLQRSKGNYDLLDSEATWFRLESVLLPNGDSVGVHEPFDISAVISEAEVKQVEEREARTFGYRSDILEAMTTDSQTLSELLPNLAKVWGLSSRNPIRDRVLAALQEGESNAERVTCFDSSDTYLIWREDRKIGKTTGLTVFKQKCTDQRVRTMSDGSVEIVRDETQQGF